MRSAAIALLLAGLAWPTAAQEGAPGIGPRGPVGAAGAAGAQGPKGDTGATGSQGPKGDPGATGPAGSAGATGATGPAGIVPIYGASGLRSGVKSWMGAVISANGLWSASIASAGCTATPYNVQVQAQGVDQTAAGVRMANVSAASATTISGTVSQPSTSVLGLLSLSLVTTGTPTIWVEAFCN